MNRFEEVFTRVVNEPRYLKNQGWGEPRPGHPEGTIRSHIAELEQNLQRIAGKLTDDDYWRLKVVVHIHDTFKPESKENVAITHPSSHASLAREFLSDHCDDAAMLAIVQFHDEPFALWRQAKHKGSVNRDRFQALIANIKDWNLFLAFCIVDGCTEGKSRESLEWFFAEIQGQVQADFTASDILR